MKLQFLPLKLILIMSIGTFVGCKNYEPLETVPSVDVDKYMGLWYEISTIPQRFQKGCHCTTAEYKISDKGYVIVKNTCRKNSLDGPISQIEGKAFIVKGSNNSKLKVQFFWPLRGKYWIIDLGSDYSYAVVGHPNRKYLWILSRTPQMNEELYQQIVSRLKEKGYNTDMLVKTMH